MVYQLKYKPSTYETKCSLLNRDMTVPGPSPGLKNTYSLLQKKTFVNQLQAKCMHSKHFYGPSNDFRDPCARLFTRLLVLQLHKDDQRTLVGFLGWRMSSHRRNSQDVLSMCLSHKSAESRCILGVGRVVTGTIDNSRPVFSSVLGDWAQKP